MHHRPVRGSLDIASPRSSPCTLWPHVASPDCLYVRVLVGHTSYLVPLEVSIPSLGLNLDNSKWKCEVLHNLWSCEARSYLICSSTFKNPASISIGHWCPQIASHLPNEYSPDRLAGGFLPACGAVLSGPPSLPAHQGSGTAWVFYSLSLSVCSSSLFQQRTLKSNPFFFPPLTFFTLIFWALALCFIKENRDMGNLVSLCLQNTQLHLPT